MLYIIACDFGNTKHFSPPVLCCIVNGRLAEWLTSSCHIRVFKMKIRDSCLRCIGSSRSDRSAFGLPARLCILSAFTICCVVSECMERSYAVS